MTSKLIAWFDTETTSAEPTEARIVEMSITITDRSLNILEGPYTQKFNPECAIPKEASDVHGILDEHVKDCPTFKTCATDLSAFLTKYDWGFYNGIKYDATVILEEFNRAGLDIDVSQIQFIDPMVVFHKKEPRDLSAAVKFYTGGTLECAHGAEADISATIEVAKGQIWRYEDINSVDDMIALTEPENRCDVAGKIVLKDGVPIFTFGKHKGEAISTHPGFLGWMLGKDFPSETKKWINNYLLKLNQPKS